MNRVIAFFKKDIVLCAALILAACSMLVVPPDSSYLEYVDFRTLAILFCLMNVMAGLQKIGVFNQIAEKLLAHVKSECGVILTLVLLVLFLQYADYQRRGADYFCTLYLYCAPYAWSGTERPAASAGGGDADYRGELGKYADAHRQPSKFISLWRSGTFSVRVCDADATVYGFIPDSVGGLGIVSGQPSFPDTGTGRTAAP